MVALSYSWVFQIVPWNITCIAPSFLSFFLLTDNKDLTTVSQTVTGALQQFIILLFGDLNISQLCSYCVWDGWWIRMRSAPSSIVESYVCLKHFLEREFALMVEFSLDGNVLSKFGGYYSNLFWHSVNCYPSTVGHFSLFPGWF